MLIRLSSGIAVVLAAAIALPSAARSRDDLVVDRVVILMRHGVRPPTKSPPMPLAITPERWPDWPVQPGWLTPHGATAVAALGRHDRAALITAGLLPSRGCPATGAVAIIADSDERTIETARRWVEALAPGCSVPIDSKPRDVSDPRFSPIDEGAVTVDPARADRAVSDAVGVGGIAAVEGAHRALLKRLDTILCGDRSGGCGVSAEPSGIKPATASTRPKLTGALDRASTAAQILLLEYADGKPMSQVGWGRAKAADIAALAEFHALEFRLLASPRYLASLNLALLAPQIVAVLTSDAKDAPAVTMISGHDTTVASLGGLLGVHWHLPGFAADDPAPGGAIILERLHDTGGHRFVRVVYRAQSLQQIRDAAGLAGGARSVVLAVEGCRARATPGLCSLDQIVAHLSTR